MVCDGAAQRSSGLSHVETVEKLSWPLPRFSAYSGSVKRETTCILARNATLGAVHFLSTSVEMRASDALSVWVYIAEQDVDASASVQVTLEQAAYAHASAHCLIVDPCTASVTIRASDRTSFVHALQTLARILSPRSSLATGDQRAFVVYDYPEWPYRGLMMDVARNNFSSAFIVRTVQVLSYLKMSTLHLHGTDDSAFSFFIPGKRLQTSDTFDLRRIRKECTFWGIELLLEVDMPGHAHSWGTRHIARCPKRIKRLGEPWGIPLEWNADARGAVRKIIRWIARESISAPGLPRTHLGGDEVDIPCWEESSGQNHREAYEQLLQRTVANEGMRESEVIRWDDAFSASDTNSLRAMNDLFSLQIDMQRVALVWEDAESRECAKNPPCKRTVINCYLQRESDKVIYV
ncbi:hypothetical protein CYMTET_4025 [Cymbomonas tetramitiformis]|uniref:beta-N-acetylhexosaminidase n=1 Tax=Cymbomonas tetramitiformis TaxID=36881 RepID=A0AAE0LKT5_9CHLO|nr:hypothetical protein CYMTET_4025 [Cymbomonas tetramitiformis]